MPSTRVLAAVPQTAVPIIKRVFGTDVPYVAVHTLLDAKSRLASGDFSVVLCGVFFDQSRMFELLGYVKERFPAVVFVSCRFTSIELPAVAEESLVRATLCNGADDYVDFVRMVQELGEEQAQVLLRTRLVGRAGAARRRGSQHRAGGRARVLVADIPPAHPRIASALSGYEVEYVTGMKAADIAMKDRPFDLVMVGMDLNESNPMDVVRAVQSTSRQTPVVCVRAAELKYRTYQGTVQAFALACRELGVRGFINFFDYPNDAVGDAAIRAEIEKLAALDGPELLAKPRTASR